jgi:hypothetical protein
MQTKSFASGQLRNLSWQHHQAETGQELKMANPKYTITRDVSVGIYDNCEYIARVYADKIIVVSPYIKWVGNTGGYAESKQAIRDTAVVVAVLADLADDCEDSAWAKIGRALGDEYLSFADFAD